MYDHFWVTYIKVYNSPRSICWQSPALVGKLIVVLQSSDYCIAGLSPPAGNKLPLCCSLPPLILGAAQTLSEPLGTAWSLTSRAWL